MRHVCAAVVKSSSVVVWMQIRRATKDDSKSLASLIDLAGKGLPVHLWTQMKSKNQSALDFGAERAARDEGGFSYRYAWVAEQNREVAAMILGCKQPNPYSLEDLDENPEFMRPIVELEAEAPGSWYISALATFPQFRQQGMGGALLSMAESISEDEGCDQISLIVSSANSNAIRLYKSVNFRPLANKAIVPLLGHSQSGDWVLMAKDL